MEYLELGHMDIHSITLWYFMLWMWKIVTCLFVLAYLTKVTSLIMWMESWYIFLFLHFLSVINFRLLVITKPVFW